MLVLDQIRWAMTWAGDSVGVLWVMILAMTPTDWLQVLGAATGVIGALLLALNASISRFGYVAYAVSNLTWLTYGWIAGVPGLVVMQLMFAGTTLLGLRNWFMKRSASATPAGNHGEMIHVRQ